MNSQQWALDLWDHGYQTILAPLRGKSPRMSWKQWQTERVPRAMVEEWYRHGQHNIAVLTGAVGGIVVVDGDSADACGVIESTCTPTPMVVKTSKGAHYYYGHPGGRVPNAVRVLDEPPIDLRGDGGLVIGPGSLHASGAYYQINDGHDLVAVSSLPAFNRDWFQVEDARATTFTHSKVVFADQGGQDAYAQAQRYMAGVPGAIQGAGGDSHTYIQACRLVRGFALGDNEALSLLCEWNQKCEPPWNEADLAEKIRHARVYGSGEIGSMLVRGGQRGGLVCVGWYD